MYFLHVLKSRAHERRTIPEWNCEWNLHVLSKASRLRCCETFTQRIDSDDQTFPSSVNHDAESNTEKSSGANA